MGLNHLFADAICFSFGGGWLCRYNLAYLERYVLLLGTTVGE